MTGGSDVPIVIGRYALFDKIGSGGMASVFLGRMTGAAGLSRTVAVKRMHPHLAEDKELTYMLLDEARITMRIRHPNVVPTLDVTQLGDELLIVMDYVVGASLAELLARAADLGEPPPPAIIATILSQVLHGLHAAHEVRDERGEPLSVVHRDVSPQNILVGADGAARVLDFGIAKAAGRMHSTQNGQAKGKLAYMAPEQLQSTEIDRRADVFAAGIVLWEALTQRRLFAEASEALTIARVLRGVVPPPSNSVPGLDARVDEVCARALLRNKVTRYATAREMALALEACGTVPMSTVASYVERLCADALLSRASRVLRTETTPPPAAEGSDVTVRDPAPPVTSPTPVRTAVAEAVRTLVSVTPQPMQRDLEARAPTGPTWRVLVPALVLAALGVVGARAALRHDARPRAMPPVVVAAPAPPAPPEPVLSAPSTDRAPVAPPEADAQAARVTAAKPTATRTAVRSTPAGRPNAGATARPAADASAPAPAAPPKCRVVPVSRADGTLDFVEKCE